jgi:hypothetical protein
MPRLRPLRNAPTDVEDLMPEDNTPPTEDIVIELNDDEVSLATPPEPAPEPAPAPAPAPAPDDAIRQALEAQQRAEEMARVASRERDDANRRAAERERELTEERGRTDDARYTSILTAIAAEQSNMAKAEADLAQAYQAGDPAAMSKAQRVLGVAAARLDRLEENKADFDQQRETSKRAPPPRQAPPPPTDLQSQISAMDIPESAKSWLRTHPEFVTDQGKVKKLGAAHQAVTELHEIPAFSHAYFDALDEQLGLKAAPAPAPAPSPQPQRRSVPVSAPVSREPPTSSGQRSTGNQITLTPEERAIARNSFGAVNGKELTNAEKERLYALNKAKYQKMRANGTYSDARDQR